MKSVTIAKSRLVYSASLNQYEGIANVPGQSIPVYMTADSPYFEELCELAESAIDDWGNLVDRILNAIRHRSVEGEYLTAAAAEALTADEVITTALRVLDDGDGPYLDVKLDLQCWFTEADDARQARYIEDPDDGSCEIEVYTY